jgi:hypothetical protein
VLRFFVTIRERSGVGQTERKGTAPKPPATGPSISASRIEKIAQYPQNSAHIYKWSTPLLTGSGSQIEINLAPGKQSPEKFLTGARTAFRNSAAQRLNPSQEDKCPNRK